MVRPGVGAAVVLSSAAAALLFGGGVAQASSAPNVVGQKYSDAGSPTNEVLVSLNCYAA